MVVFGRDPGNHERIDYGLLKCGPLALYHDTALLERDADAIEALGYEKRDLDLVELSGRRVFHDRVAALLDFPDYYGRNLNALNDCIQLLKGLLLREKARERPPNLRLARTRQDLEAHR